MTARGRLFCGILASLWLGALGGLAQVPYQPGQMGSLPALLAVEQVRKDLHLSPFQVRQLDALRTEFRDAARKIVGDASLTPSKKPGAAKRLDALTQSTNQRALRILSATQQKALLLHEHRYLGAALLYFPEVQSHLGLTDRQSQRIASLQSEAQAQASQINSRFENGAIGPHERRALLRKDRLKRNSRLLAVLTPKQKATFEALPVGKRNLY